MQLRKKKMSKFRLMLRQTHWAPQKITWLVVLIHSKNMLIISNNHPFGLLNITKYLEPPTKHKRRNDRTLDGTQWLISSSLFRKNAMLEYAMVFVDKHYWLVVYLPSEKYEFVSWDYDIPNIWKNNKCSKTPTKL